MSLTMIGKKRGMTRLFDKKSGKTVSCTIIELQPNVVSQIKSVETDGYSAVQVAGISLSDADKKRQSKPLRGHFTKRKIEPKRVLLETRVQDTASWKEGQEISADYFEEGSSVDVIAKSKGKGYQGVVKRHNYSTFGGSHGVGPVERHAGSMGSLTAHGRVQKGKKMAGHMGDERCTVENLSVIEIDTGLGALVVKGSIPGGNGSTVYIRKSLKQSLKNSK